VDTAAVDRDVRRSIRSLRGVNRDTIELGLAAAIEHASQVPPPPVPRTSHAPFSRFAPSLPSDPRPRLGSGGLTSRWRSGLRSRLVSCPRARTRTRRPRNEPPAPRIRAALDNRAAPSRLPRRCSCGGGPRARVRPRARGWPCPSPRSAPSDRARAAGTPPRFAPLAARDPTRRARQPKSIPARLNHARRRRGERPPEPQFAFGAGPKATPRRILGPLEARGPPTPRRSTQSPWQRLAPAPMHGRRRALVAPALDSNAPLPAARGLPPAHDREEHPRVLPSFDADAPCEPRGTPGGGPRRPHDHGAGRTPRPVNRERMALG